jgi:predicted alpha/beta superfamily hydrolase
MIALALALAAAPPVASPIVLGTSIALDATALGDRRAVNVVLPPSYAANPKRRYPVVFVIDGGVDQDLVHVAGTAMLGAIWGRNQEAIIVGVEPRQRRRELVGPTRDAATLAKYPEAGHSGLFRAFLRNQVKPMIAARYRTSGKDAVIGESLAGLFIVETYLVEPSLFGGYGAVSPSLWWDQQALSKGASRFIGARQAGHPLYLATANEGAEAKLAADRLVAALAARAGQWCYARREDLTHATIYHTVSPTLFQYLVPPAEAPAPEFGFEVPCSRKS